MAIRVCDSANMLVEHHPQMQFQARGDCYGEPPVLVADA